MLQCNCFKKQTKYFDSEVPWIMCEHNPGFNSHSAIQTINGFWDEHQADKTSWPSPKWITTHIKDYPNQPLFWTEDQAWYNGWGNGPLVRPVNEIANGILRWYALGGTYHNFYMLYGGNNFARNAGKNVATAYANDAPINSFGIANNPKYNHLTKLFGILKDYADCIVNMDSIPNRVTVNNNSIVETVRYYNQTTNVTFLSNIGSYFQSVTVFGNVFDLAANSTLILDISHNVLFNSSDDGNEGKCKSDCDFRARINKKTKQIKNKDSCVFLLLLRL